MAIQAHPTRARYIPYLHERLGPAPVAWSRQPETGQLDVWPTHKAARRMAADVPFHLVVQDDALIGRNFYRRLEAALRAHGEVVYGLFYRLKGGKRFEEFRRAGREGRTKGYATWPKLQWAVASVVPTAIVEDMIAFCDPLVMKGREDGQDDIRMSRYFIDQGIPVVYPLPSLVDHRSRGVGLTGHKNAGRVAWWFQ